MRFRSEKPVTKAGSEAFEAYYEAVYFSRWKGLRQALVQPSARISFEPKWEDPAGEMGFDLSRAEEEPKRNHRNLLDRYYLDPASVLAALALGVHAGEQVLDMCAAPGGKSLVLATALRFSGELICNERSQIRRERLTKVIQNYIPKEVRSRIWVTGKDARDIGVRQVQKYDRILLDAPCSGERHLLENQKEIALWTEARPQRIAQDQYALLCSAALAIKKGGRIVYSTCTINPRENDGVIEKFLKKKKNFEVKMDFLSEPFLGEMGERTRFGRCFFPDRSTFGPIYFCTLRESS